MEQFGLDYLIDMLVKTQILQSDPVESNEICSAWVTPQEKEIDMETQY